jgi:hypothetical protein
MYHVFSRIAFVLLFCYLSINLTAQTVKNIASQPVVWLAYFGTHRLSDSWSVWTEVQVRRADYGQTSQQNLVRVAGTYHLSKTANISVGYGYFLTYPYGDQPIPLEEPRPEQRPWQQLQLLQSSDGFDFHHRFRLEQRYLQNWSPPEAVTRMRQLTEGYELQNRMRYRFLASTPISINTEGKTDFFVTGYNEIFVNFGQNVGVNIFDQNRLGLTVGYNLSSLANIQLGYMNQYIQKSNGTSFESNNALTLFLTVNTDWR